MAEFEAFGDPPAHWDDWVAAHPHGSVFQSTRWADYWSAYMGATPWYLVGNHEGADWRLLVLHGSPRGEAVADRRLGPLRLIRLLPRTLTWREGPLVTPADRIDRVLPAIFEAIARFSRDRGAAGISGSWLPLDAGVEAAASDLLRDAHLTRRATIRVRLQEPLDDIWSALKSDVARTPVRKARKQKLRLVEASTPRQIDRFYSLIETWRRAQGLSAVSPSKYRLLPARMPDASRIFLAEKDGEAMGGAGLWHFAGRAYLFSPVQSLEARERRIYAGDFLYWEMIRWCHDQGFEYFDLSGVSPDPDDPKEKGIRRFKEKWGGDLIEYREINAPIRRLRWRLAGQDGELPLLDTEVRSPG